MGQRISRGPAGHPRDAAARALTAARGAWQAVCSAILSPRCATCDRPIDDPLDGAVCPACWASIRVLTPPLCARCGYPVMRGTVVGADLAALQPCANDDSRGAALRPRVNDDSRGAGLQPRVNDDSRGAGLQPCSLPSCLGCSELRVVDRARALGPYEGVLRDVLHALKYAGRRSTAPHLARLLRERCAALLDGADAVVPVPLHPRRAWTRGFNQAALVANHLGPPVLHALRRRDHTAPQASLPAESRSRNVARAFAPSLRTRLRPSLLRGACLVLVDDVSTTGATLDACARVLKEYGAREVRALTVARTLKGSAGR